MSDQPEGTPAALVNEALRAWYGTFSELSRQFALHLGMHGSDASALVHITTAEERGEPLTQTQLSRRIGLTTPATSSLLNRLEDAGHVERRRDSADRRVVTVRSTPAVHAEVHDFFRGVGDDFERLMSPYPDGVLTAFTELVTGMTAAMDRHLEAITQQRG